MLSSFIYSVNSVVPLFLLVLFGMFLKSRKFLNNDYCNIADRLVFNYALPFESFKSVYNSDLKVLFSEQTFKVMIFFIVGMVLSFVILCITVPRAIKEKGRIGAFIQGAFRGNFTLFALPLAGNMFGDAGKAAAAPMILIVVLMFNALSVIGFNIFAPSDDDKKSFGKMAGGIILSTVKNPLICSVVFGCIGSVLRSAWAIRIPVFAMSAIEDIASLAVPLALISLGAGFDWNKLKSNVGVAMAAVSVKNVIMPVIALPLAVLIGIKGIPLALVLLAFGGPTSVSSYVMAKNMKGDHELAGQILLLSTICSLATVFAFVFVLKQLGLI